MRHLRKLTMRRLGQALYNGALTHLPSFVFNRQKIYFLRLLGADIASSAKLGNHLKILGPTGLTIEEDSAVASGVVLDARGKLHLRRGALIGFESVLLTYTHESSDLDRPVHQQGVVSRPIVVGENSWIGARCIVLPGGTIGHQSIVGALAVVSRPVPDRSVAAGNPARVLKAR